MAGDVTTSTVSVGDRKLCIETAGDPSGRPVLACAGTPNSRHLYRGWIEDAEARGIRLIGYDRPGYGGSDPHPGGTVADGAGDARAIASALGLDRLAVWGVSGGGPYALACAALLPDLVVATGVLGSIAPYDAPDLDFFSGMGEDNEQDVKLFFRDREAAREKSKRDREQMLSVTADGLLEVWSTLLSPADAAVVSGDFADYRVMALASGLRPGDQGWWDDGVAHFGPWGFDLADIRVPVKIWHGREDRFVPFQHGRWLAEHVPGAEAELTDTDGHLTVLIEKIGEVHAWLLSHF